LLRALYAIAARAAPLLITARAAPLLRALCHCCARCAIAARAMPLLRALCHCCARYAITATACRGGGRIPRAGGALGFGFGLWF
jgi:hypothetical protein